MMDLSLDRGSMFDYLAITSTNSLAVPAILFWDWTIYELLVLYWGESAIFIFLSMLSVMLLGVDDDKQTQETQRVVSSWTECRERLQMSGGIALTFGFFWLIHGAIIGGIRKELSFGTVPLDVTLVAVSSVLSVLAASHLIRWCRDIYHALSRQSENPHQLSVLFDRTGKLHVVVLLTAFLTIPFGSPKPLLVGVVLVKIAYDVYLE